MGSVCRHQVLHGKPHSRTAFRHRELLFISILLSRLRAKGNPPRREDSRAGFIGWLEPEAGCLWQWFGCYVWLSRSVGRHLIGGLFGGYY